jgi:hypothetical protein
MLSSSRHSARALRMSWIGAGVGGGQFLVGSRAL